MLPGFKTEDNVIYVHDDIPNLYILREPDGFCWHYEGEFCEQSGDFETITECLVDFIVYGTAYLRGET